MRRVLQASLLFLGAAAFCNPKPNGLRRGVDAGPRPGLPAALSAKAKNAQGRGFGAPEDVDTKFNYDLRTVTRANDVYAKLAAVLKADTGGDFGKKKRLTWEEVTAGNTITVADVYVRGSTSNKMWFAGKVAAGAGHPQGAYGAAWAQRSLIFEHARRLRPQELGLPGVDRSFELFCAPGDSEIAVVQDEERMYRADAKTFESAGVPKTWAEVAAAQSNRSGVPLGFQPEYYEEGEAGFYTIKGQDGESLGEPVKINITNQMPPQQ